MKINHQPNDKNKPPHKFPPENLNENIIFSKKVEIVGQEQIKEMWILYSRKGAKIDLYCQLHLPIHANKVILIINQEDDWTEFRNIDEVINQLQLDQSGKEFNYRIFMVNFLYSTVRTPASNLIEILKSFEMFANQALLNLISHSEESKNFDKFIEIVTSYLNYFAIKSFNDNQDESNKLLSKSPPQDPHPPILTQAIDNKPDKIGTSPPHPQAIEVARDLANFHDNSVNLSSDLNSEVCKENPKTSTDLDGLSDFISDNETESDKETKDMSSVTSRKTFEYDHLCEIDYSHNKSRNKYDIYNSKNSSNEVTKISKLTSDAFKESAIKKNVQDAIRSSINQFNENDDADSTTKLKSYKYLLIAIYSQGVNKNEQYKNFLELVNNGLSEQDKLTYSEAKKLSLIFQNICSGKNVFTGRIHSDENSRLVGMRTKRIPLELLLETAKQDLKRDDFEKLKKFKKTIKEIKSKFENPISNQLSSRKRSQERNQLSSQLPISPESILLSSTASSPLSPIDSLSLSSNSSLSSPNCLKLFPSPTLPQRTSLTSRSRSESPSRSRSQSLSLSENLHSTPSKSRSQSESPRPLEPQSASIKSQSQSKRSRSLSPNGHLEKENIHPNSAVNPNPFRYFKNDSQSRR